MTASSVRTALKNLADPKRAKTSQWFFKTAKGEYGEGDIFLGITVPEERKIAKKFKDIALSEVKKLLESAVHDHRFVALEILVFKYEAGTERERKAVVEFYLKHRKWVNNWDLVDTSASYILGDWLLKKPRSILYTLARSKSLWDRRIAVVATWALIRENDLKDIFKLSAILLKDREDLIHKAVGWMLREAGKKSEPALKAFLRKYASRMPRTMLRYAIEKFTHAKRKQYLAVKPDTIKT